jgi:hypothetical protein
VEGESAAIGAVVDDGADTLYWEVLWKEAGVLGYVEDLIKSLLDIPNGFSQVGQNTWSGSILWKSNSQTRVLSMLQVLPQPPHFEHDEDSIHNTPASEAKHTLWTEARRGPILPQDCSGDSHLLVRTDVQQSLL